MDRSTFSCILLASFFLSFFFSNFTNAHDLSGAINWKIDTSSASFSSPLPSLSPLTGSDFFKKLISESLRLQTPGPNGVPSKYVLDMLKIVGPSSTLGWLDLFCPSRNVKECPNKRHFPGPNVETFPLHWQTVARLAEMPAKQWSGKWWRGSEAGSLITSPFFYSQPVSNQSSRPPINPMGSGFGSTPKQHAALRPVLMSAFYLEWKSRTEVENIQNFLTSSLIHVFENAKKKGKLEKIDFDTWFHQALNKIAFDRVVSPQYTQTFKSIQTQMLQAHLLSNAIPRQYWPADFLKMKDLRKAVVGYVKEYKPIIKKKYGHLLKGKDCSPSVSCLEQAAYAMFDAMSLIGIPTTFMQALAVMFSADKSNPAGVNGLSYSKNESRQVYWETIRMFPPVRAFPYWTRRPTCPGQTVAQTARLNKAGGRSKPCPLGSADKLTGYPTVNQYYGGYRKLISLSTAQSDPAVWGRDAYSFRPRPLAHYERHSVGFAEPAVDRSTAGGRMNRACPGRSLALLMGTTFLEVFEKHQWFVDPKKKRVQIRTGGPYLPDIELLYTYNQTNCREILCGCVGSAGSLTTLKCKECVKLNKNCPITET